MTINDIITAPKVINRKRHITWTLDEPHYRADIPVVCNDLPYEMTMFMRKLVDMPENFSIGLRLNGPMEPFDYAVVLVRFQGPHGGQSALRSLKDLHNSYHIHLYTQEDMDYHRKNASYKESASFCSIEGAIMAFLEYCHIDDKYGIFDKERERYAQIQMQLDNM